MTFQSFQELSQSDPLKSLCDEQATVNKALAAASRIVKSCEDKLSKASLVYFRLLARHNELAERIKQAYSRELSIHDQRRRISNTEAINLVLAGLTPDELKLLIEKLRKAD